MDAFDIPHTDSAPRPRLATIAAVHGLTHTLDETSASSLVLPLQTHFVRAGYVTIGSATQQKEITALTQHAQFEQSRDPSVLRVAGATRPKRKLPTDTTGHTAPTVFASFEAYMAAANEHIYWVRRASETDANKLGAYYHAVQHEWHTTATFKKNLKLLTMFCPRLRQHLLHSAATDWGLPRSDPQLVALLTTCKDQAEIEADRVRAQPPATGGGGGKPSGGADAGRNRRFADAANPAVPLPTTIHGAMEQGWHSHNAPPGQQLCLKHTFGQCTNKAEGNGCVDANGTKRVHACCFCGSATHKVGKDVRCPAPKRPPA